MTAMFGVKVDSVESRLLQLTAFNAGYFWSVARGEKTVRYTDEPHLYIGDDKSICWCNKVSIGDTIIPFAAAMEFLLTGKKMWKDAAEIDLGKYKAFVMPGEYIKAGCVTLNKEEVEQLLKAYNDDTKEELLTYYGVHCDDNMGFAIVELGKKLGWTTHLSKNGYGEKENTFYFKPSYTVGMMGFVDDFRDTHPDGNPVKIVTVAELLIGLSDGTIAPVVKRKTIEYTFNGKHFVVLPGRSIEIKNEMTLSYNQVDRLERAWKE